MADGEVNAAQTAAQPFRGRLLDGLARRPWVRVVGPTDAVDRGSSVAFVVDDQNPRAAHQRLDVVLDQRTALFGEGGVQPVEPDVGAIHAPSPFSKSIMAPAMALASTL